MVDKGTDEQGSKGPGQSIGTPWLVMRELTVEEELRGWSKCRSKMAIERGWASTV